MSNVTLNIGGRDYTVACDAGEEVHLGELAMMIDAKLATMPSGAPRNDARALLFAALLLADELSDLRRSIAGHPPTGQPPTKCVPASGDTVPAEQVDALAARLEALADALEVAG